MKLAFVEMCGFRGFRDPARFDLPTGFAVITGRNGVGKSTVLDAIEFVLTGTINKFHGVKSARGGGLDEHIWWVGAGTPEAHYVKVGFVDETGRKFEIERSRENGLTTPLDQIAAQFCANAGDLESWPDTLMQTTLIRDETITSLSMDLAEQARANAVRAAIGVVTRKETPARTKAIVDAAKEAKVAAAARVDTVRANLSRALTMLTEVRSVADQSADFAHARKTISELEGQVVENTPDFGDVIGRRLAARRRSITIIQDAIATAEELESERAYFASEGDKRIEQTAKSIDQTTRIADEQTKTLQVAKAALSAERDSDELITHLVEICRHGEVVGLRDGHCPLCDAPRSEIQFRTSIESLKSQLDKRYRTVENLAQQAQQAEHTLTETKTELDKLVSALADLNKRRASLNDSTRIVEHVFEVELAGGSITDLTAVRQALLKKQVELADLEQAVLVVQSSTLQDRVTTADSRVRATRSQLQDEEAKLVVAERALELGQQIDASGKTIVNEMLNEQFDVVLPLLKEFYRRLRPHTDWREIETDFGGKVRASLNFTVGDGYNPQFMFSSGQRRAAGIAFLLAIHLSRPWCHLQSLLLDDPVQHIDDYRALNLAEVLSAIRRTGRQVIVAVEDQALADALGRKLRATTQDGGCMFSLVTSDNGSASIESRHAIRPMNRNVIQLAG